ncbi:MAG: DAK2 domain-containing protein [Anaeroplasmataceae bacterium]
MSNNTIGSSLLKKMIKNGAINLKNQHKEIDSLNVFPVPDGDTGTNMQMTMMSGVAEMEKCQSDSIVDLAKALSRGLLMGARGNSGVILSQFFRGIYVKIKELGKEELSLNDFVLCLVSGYEVAYKAVMEPVEGTILTVVREAAQKMENEKSFESLEDLLRKYINQAKISLENTPNLLPVLKEAGVVDSGGAGFIKVAEGMLLAVKDEILEDIDSNAVSSGSAQSEVSSDIKYGYCTEFIIDLNEGVIFNESDLREPLLNMGDSLVLVNDENLVKVHVHVNNPGAVLELAQKYGEFVKIKVENMRLQHSELINKEAEKKEEVKEAPKKEYGIISVCFGDGIKNTFKELGVDYIIDGGQTMNPPTEEFVKAVKAVNAENVIIIPNNSNVILSAEQATKICDDQKIAVLKAKTVAQGYASLMVFDPSMSLEENVEEMTNVIKHTGSGEITYAVRDTEIKGVKIQSGDYMGICNGEIVVSVVERIEATKEVLNQLINEDSAIVTIFYGNTIEESEALELKSYCENINEDLEVVVIEGNQEIYSYIISVE